MVRERASEEQVAKASAHGANAELLRPGSAPGPAQVLPAPLIGSALRVTRQRGSAPPIGDCRGALSILQAVLDQEAADSPSCGYTCPVRRHDVDSVRLNARGCSATFRWAQLLPARLRSVPLPAGPERLRAYSVGSWRVSSAFFVVPVLGLFPSEVRVLGVRRSGPRRKAAFPGAGRGWGAALATPYKAGFCKDRLLRGLSPTEEVTSANPERRGQLDLS